MGNTCVNDTTTDEAVASNNESKAKLERSRAGSDDFDINPNIPDLEIAIPHQKMNSTN